jgi:hypothetical protein
LPPFHFFHVAFAAALFLLCAGGTRANPSPLFGDTLTINGTTYSCVIDDGNGGTDYQTSEDGTYQTGVYQATGGGSGTLTLYGKIGQAALATVIGSNGSSLNGYLQNGTYGDLVQSSSEPVSMTFNDRAYDNVTMTTTYEVNLDAGQLTSSVSVAYSGPGGSFTVAADGTINGTESGVYLNGTWYVDSFTSESTNYTSPNGVNYTLHVASTTHVLDGNGGVNASTTQIYSGPSGAFTIAPDGAISDNESGFYVNGTWYVNSSSTASINLTLPNGHVYTSQTSSITYTRNENGEVMANESAGSYNGPSGSFSVAADGSLSGSESGYYVNGNWYLNGVFTESISYTSPTGKVYTSRTGNNSYSLDGSGSISNTGSGGTYSGSGVSFTIGGDGAISGDESGYVVNGNWYVNSSNARPAGAQMSLFGTLYTCTGGSENTSYDSLGNGTTSYSDHYGSTDGGYVDVWSSSNGTPGSSGMNGWDYYVGSFNSDMMTGSLVLAARSGPSLLPAQVWVNGAVLNWQSGAVEESGTVTDHYTGTDVQGAGITLSVIGQMREYDTNGASATVRINEADAGTLTKSGGLSVSGYDVQSSDPNRTAPLFFAGPMLWVNGSEYPFSGGYEDSAGHRTDTYVAPGGGTLTIVGSVASPDSGTVQVAWNETPYSGTATFGGGSASFEVGDLDISTLPPGSPPALWAAGRFYLRQPGSNNYVCTVGSGAEAVSYQIHVNGADVAQLTLSGTGSGGTLSGTFDASQGGVFALMQNGSVLVAACPANADGTLRQSAEEPSENLPPAVMVTGAGIWRFLGTLSESGGVVACYLNASAANSTEASDGAGCMLKIDATGVVTLHHYVAGTTQSGSYSLATHLFQTATTSSLPMPIYGVDPNASNLPWGLTAPADGPASFQVGDELWRYTGAGENGAALYQGYYNGQQLTLGAADAGGGRLVTVTDPVGGNTTGLLNDVRAGTRLTNGTMVYAGGMDGTRAPSTVNNNGLLALSGNLDIPGNVLTLGSLNGDAATAGLMLKFSDTGSQALLSTTLERDAAQWSWWRMNPNDPAATVPVMAVDSAFGLVLYDPAGSSQAGVVLNPAADGVSSLRGVLRVRPGGDIPMGIFQEGDPP